MMITMKSLKENPLMRVLFLLALIAAIIIFLIIDANFFAVKRINVRHQTLESEKIPLQMDDMNILFFSDLEYGTFMDEKRLASLVETINNTGADTVIFGGDMFDYAAVPTEESVRSVKELLSAIEAPYGKFAVYGDNDRKDEETLATVTSILESAGFEILNNRSILLHKGALSSITLVGLDNGLNGTQDIEAAYSSVSPSSYVITVCHTPDSSAAVPGDITDYFLSGHSHGGQIYYIFGAFYTPAMATEYLRGIHNIANEFTLDITNGVGTTQKDARFLANAEVVLYRLVSDEHLPEPTPEATIEAVETPQETAPAENTQEEAAPAQSDQQPEESTAEESEQNTDAPE